MILYNIYLIIKSSKSGLPERRILRFPFNNNVKICFKKDLESITKGTEATFRFVGFVLSCTRGLCHKKNE